MTTGCMHTLFRAVGARSIGDLIIRGAGDGPTILIGVGEARGMPDGMTLGIGGRIGIILTGDILEGGIRGVLWLARA